MRQPDKRPSRDWLQTSLFTSLLAILTLGALLFFGTLTLLAAAIVTQIR